MQATAVRTLLAVRPSPASNTSPSAPTPEPAEPRSKIGSAIHWLDEYTRPRPSTGGDFEENDYFQSCIHAVESGYAFMGMKGMAITTAAALTSTFTVRHTKSKTAGLVVGAATGAIAAAAMAGFSGPTAVGLAVGGSLLGGLMSLRGDARSKVRDASGGASMITGLFMPGTSKLAGSIAAGLGASQEKPWQQAAVGAVVGGVIGAALGAAGLAGGGPLVSGAIAAAGGAIGPFFGPRFSQLFRNLANDSGKGFVAVARKLGVDESKISETQANIVGAFPAEFAKEGIRSFINSDHSLSAVLTGGLMESIELVQVFLKQKKAPAEPQPEQPAGEPKAEQPPLASPAPPPAAPGGAPRP